MSHFQSAVSILLEAETKLRGVVQQAAASGDYDAVVKIAALAREIDALRASVAPATLPAKPKTMLATPPFVTKGKNERSATYPSFAKQKDALVKVGWSKTSRAEYEHRAPRTSLHILATVVADKARRTGKFTTDDIFPLRNSDGSEIPVYQSYVCLAWLCATGVLQRNGRQGYAVVTDGRLDDVVERLWEDLPDR